MELIEFRNVSKSFGGKVVLSNLDLKIGEGEIRALIGPNGAGKTVVLNIISGFYKPDKGEVYFNGDLLNPRMPYEITHLGVGRTFQNVEIFPGMTVLENVVAGFHRDFKSGLWSVSCGLKRAKEEEARLRQEGMKKLEFVGLAASAHELAKNLPYGKRRLLELARALATSPRLLMLDEPVAGMSNEEIENLKDLLHRLKNLGITILLVEHVMRLVMDISHLITVLDYGEKIAEGSPQEIASNEKVMEAYLGKKRDAKG